MGWGGTFPHRIIELCHTRAPYKSLPKTLVYIQSRTPLISQQQEFHSMNVLSKYIGGWYT